MSFWKMKSFRPEWAVVVVFVGCGTVTASDPALREIGCPPTELEQRRACDTPNLPSTYACAGAHRYEVLGAPTCVYDPQGELIGASDETRSAGLANPDQCVFSDFCDPHDCMAHPELPATCRSLASFSSRCQPTLEAQVAWSCVGPPKFGDSATSSSVCSGIVKWTVAGFGLHSCFYADGNLVGVYSAGDHSGLEVGAGNWNWDLGNCTPTKPCPD